MIEAVDKILLEALNPYEQYPMWASIVCYLDDSFDRYKGLANENHRRHNEDFTNEQNSKLKCPDCSQCMH